jgi:hypothetical protein
MTRINEVLGKLERGSKMPIPPISYLEDAAREIRRLRTALERIEGYVDSEAADPMDEMLEIATAALKA